MSLIPLSVALFTQQAVGRRAALFARLGQVGNHARLTERHPSSTSNAQTLIRLSTAPLARVSRYGSGNLVPVRGTAHLVIHHANDSLKAHPLCTIVLPILIRALLIPHALNGHGTRYAVNDGSLLCRGHVRAGESQDVGNIFVMVVH